MQHEEQIKLMQGLMDRLDDSTNVDAGCQLKNPVDAYLSRDRALLEWQAFFQNYPQIMGLSADLDGPNSFFTSNDPGKPILCTRDKQGEFKAFINACRHRGSVVETGSRGRKTIFSCPFHAWSYSSAGDLVAVPKEDHFGDLDKSCLGLVQLPAKEAHGLLWVHPNPEGEIDVDALLGKALADELDAWKLSESSFEGTDCYPHKMNWKLAIDTFGETYHFNVLHKDTLAETTYGNVQMYDTFERNHRMMLCSKAIDQFRNQPMESWDVLTATIPVYYLFPNTQLIFTEVGPVLVRVYPNGPDPDDSYSQISFYIRPEVRAIMNDPTFDQGPISISERLKGFGEVIRDEDYVAAASSHVGMQSGAIPYVIYGRNEPALHHYHNTYRDALGMPPLETV